MQQVTLEFFSKMIFLGVSEKYEIMSVGGISKMQSKAVITQVILPRFSGRLKFSPAFFVELFGRVVSSV